MRWFKENSTSKFTFCELHIGLQADCIILMNKSDHTVLKPHLSQTFCIHMSLYSS